MTKLQEKLISIYNGTSKNVYGHKDQAETLFFNFLDNYSVFDYGIMPDTIANKGKAQSIMAGYLFNILNKASFYENLKDSAILNNYDAYLQKNLLVENNLIDSYQKNQPTSHYISLSDGDKDINIDELNNIKVDNVFLKVKKASKFTATENKILTQAVYFYEHNKSSDTSILPLEIVFRFKLDPESSFLKRCKNNSDYAKLFNLNDVDKYCNENLPYPIIEFFSKLEPKDRLLSYSEASMMADLSAQDLKQLINFCMLMAISLKYIFNDHQIDLIDGKFEVIKITKNNQTSFILADSIGLDELRLEYDSTTLSKEILRKFYRLTDWFKLFNQNSNNKDNLPPSLSHPVKEIIDKLYGSVVNHLLQQEVFPDQLSLKDLCYRLRSIKLENGS